MTCAHIHRALSDGTVPSGTEVDAHLADCAPCAALLAEAGAVGQFLAADAPEMPDLSAMQAALFTAVAADNSLHGRLRRLSSPVRTALLVATVLGIVALTVGLLPRPDMGAYPALRMGLTLAALVGPALALLAAVTRPLHRAATPRPLITAMLLTGTLLPIGLASLPAAALEPINRSGEHFARITTSCFVFGSLCTVVVLGIYLLFDRRSRPSAAHAALAAIAGALGGNVALQLHCPINEISHLLLGHASQGALFAGLVTAAILLGRRGR